MHNKVFIRAGSEEQIEVATCEAQRLAACFGQQDVVAGRNGTPYTEH